MRKNWNMLKSGDVIVIQETFVEEKNILNLIKILFGSGKLQCVRSQGEAGRRVDN